MGKGTAWEKERHGKGNSVGEGTAWEREQRGRGNSVGKGTAFMKTTCRWLKL
ncbi:MAG: hypothetical protein ACOX84_06480 [Methanothrix sp.]|jgi:hypothetical protein|uniref:hypothetical protein n=1 Tax=Methanothrix sp. TaxID=90426 RepID=UPI001BD3A115